MVSKKRVSILLFIFLPILLLCMFWQAFPFGLDTVVQKDQKLQLGNKICNNLKKSDHQYPGQKCYISDNPLQVISRYFPIGVAEDYVLDALDGFSQYYAKVNSQINFDDEDSFNHRVYGSFYRYCIINSPFYSYPSFDVYFTFVDGELVLMEWNYRYRGDS